MAIQLDPAIEIGKPEKAVIWEYGVVTCTDKAFPVIWNGGSPEMPMQQIAGVKGATNTFRLGMFLYSTMERYIRTEIGYSTRNCSQLLTSTNQQTRLFTNSILPSPYTRRNTSSSDWTYQGSRKNVTDWKNYSLHSFGKY